MYFNNKHGGTRMDNINTDLRVFALITGSGVGTKPLQSLLDNHPEIIMIPAYPLMYLYPHWHTWVNIITPWNWDNIIDIFLEKHASVIDSRQIPGHNGLTSLGKNYDKYIKIDKALFIKNLNKLLNGVEISSRNFILAIHIAYAKSINFDTNNAKVIIYHLHNVQYLQYFKEDFPNGKVIAMSRDPRANIGGRISATYNINNSKLNSTDAILYEKYIYKDICRYLYHDTYDILSTTSLDDIVIVKLEDLYYNLEKQMTLLSIWLDIKFNNSMLHMTFGGIKWFGDKIYNMKKMNVINPRVVSKKWKMQLSRKEWFVIEGLSYSLMDKYGYRPEKYKKDSYLYRLFLVILIALPSRFEIIVFLKYLSLNNYIDFMKKSFQESSQHETLKDYTWNGTYLYKWTYIYLRLWNTPLYRKLVMDVQNAHTNNKFKYLIIKVLYLVVQNIRYLFSFVFFPAIVIKRMILMYHALIIRVKHCNNIPILLENHLKENYEK